MTRRRMRTRITIAYRLYGGKVEFGVPFDEEYKDNIPGTLMVSILKLYKEALNKDIFRAPGHQENMKKLIHFLRTGRLVNMEWFSVIQLDSIEQQRDQIHKLITSLPIYTQCLLVRLFGTFRVVAVKSKDKYDQ